MNLNSFKASHGDVVTVDPYEGGVGIDIDREDGTYVALNMDSHEATRFGLEVLERAGGLLMDLGTEPATVTVIPDSTSDNEMFELWLDRLGVALNHSTEGSPIHQVLLGLGVGFALDQSVESRLVLRALLTGS